MTENESTGRKLASRYIGTSEVLLIIIFIVSGAGVALTDMSPSRGRWFWLAMVPLLAVTSLHEGWVRARGRGDSWWFILRKQIFHWLGLLGALELVFVLYGTNRINAPEAASFPCCPSRWPPSWRGSISTGTSECSVSCWEGRPSWSLGSRHRCGSSFPFR